MPDAIDPSLPVLPPPPLPLDDGRTVLSCEGTFYRVLLADGVTVHALLARTVASMEAAVDEYVEEWDLAFRDEYKLDEQE